MLRLSSKVTTAIMLLLLGIVCAYGQTRRKRPVQKQTQKQAQPQPQIKENANSITLLYSEGGRDYYLFEVLKDPETDNLFYSYVVFFDQSTPAGRSALSKTMSLAKLSAADTDQVYYVAAIQYSCHFNLKDPTNVWYDEIFWTDKGGNIIVRMKIRPEDSATIKGDIAEISTYSEPYFQEIFDTLEKSDKSQRRLLESQIRFLISGGHEDEARKLKFEPRLPKWLPALSLFISGGAKHMSEVMNAARQAYDKGPRDVK